MTLPFPEIGRNKNEHFWQLFAIQSVLVTDARETSRKHMRGQTRVRPSFLVIDITSSHKEVQFWRVMTKRFNKTCFKMFAYVDYSIYNSTQTPVTFYNFFEFFVYFSNQWCAGGS